MKNDIVQFAVSLAQGAGEVLTAHFGRSHKITSKGDRDFVTDVDLKVERKIVDSIQRHYPEHDILSEERPFVSRNASYRWIIDPVDGTHNFMKGIPIFGVSLALEIEGRVSLGVIYMPLTKRLYVAQRGKGSYLNGRRIHVSSRPLSMATVAYDSSIRLHKKRMLRVLDRLTEEVFNLRMFGSTVEGLCLIAEGNLEMEIEFSDKPWDFAAGALLVEEAGGRFTDFAGCPWSPYIKEYVASNGKIHSQIIRLIQKASS
jgi:myo-inositol-1(or 4)-monophosphatase